MAWAVSEVSSAGEPLGEPRCGATLGEALARVPLGEAGALDAVRALLPRLSLAQLHAVALWHVREAQHAVAAREAEAARLRVAELDEDGDEVLDPTPLESVDPARATPVEWGQ